MARKIFQILLVIPTWSVFSFRISSRKERFAFFWHSWQKASLLSKRVIGNTPGNLSLWTCVSTSTAFIIRNGSTSRGVRERLRVEQSGLPAIRVLHRALGGSGVRCFYFTGVRHKPPQITPDYKPVGEPTEITGFDAVSPPLPPAAIHQHKSKGQKFSSCCRMENCMHDYIS